jgi:hypothetical protein
MNRVLAFKIPPKYRQPPPSCETCLFYKKGECLAFGTQDPVSGTVINRSAYEARTSLYMCSPEGAFWSQKNVYEIYPSLKEDINKNKK